MKKSRNRAVSTTVGAVAPDALRFTVGKDPALDAALVIADCAGTAAHATMLSLLPRPFRVLTQAERKIVIMELARIAKRAERGLFEIKTSDQDAHMAIERVLTARLGDAGRKIHTGRSRNDQVAVALRLYAKDELIDVIAGAAGLAGALLSFAGRGAKTPMVGRTHMQPAMPSSVGLWASAHAEGLLDDMIVVMAAYEYNDLCPLGSAAGFGVPLPIDRNLTAGLLGFRAPHHNVLHASNSRGKCESVVLSAVAQVMLSLSRLAEDLILYSMPEFGYFTLPPEYCTGSSIMPRKRNPDVLELVRAKAAVAIGHAAAAMAVIKALPSGYSRDLQETKEPLMEGLRSVRSCLSVMRPVIGKLRINKARLSAGFTPDVFAADRALDLAMHGVPFRYAYARVKEQGDHADGMSSPARALAQRVHLGAPGSPDFRSLRRRTRTAARFADGARNKLHGRIEKLLGKRFARIGSEI